MHVVLNSRRPCMNKPETSATNRAGTFGQPLDCRRAFQRASVAGNTLCLSGSPGGALLEPGGPKVRHILCLPRGNTKRARHTARHDLSRWSFIYNSSPACCGLERWCRVRGLEAVAVGPGDRLLEIARAYPLLRPSGVAHLPTGRPSGHSRDLPRGRRARSRIGLLPALRGRVAPPAPARVRSRSSVRAVFASAAIERTTHRALVPT